MNAGSVAIQALDQTHDAVVSLHEDGTIASWNPAAEHLYGYTAAEAVGRPMAILAPPGEEALPPASVPPPGTREVRETLRHHRRKDGELILVSLRAARRRGAAGEALLLCASERSDGAGSAAPPPGGPVLSQPGQEQRELRRLAGRLFQAQEEERRYLGRELHDDLSQRLAALVVEAQLLGRALGPSGGEGSVRAGLSHLVSDLRLLSEDVRRLSHQLHPGILERLGLAAALEAHAAELEEREHLRVQLEVREGGPPLPAAAALCLYRIAQEALHNAAHHSTAATARVTLERRGDRVRLVVADPGLGFDPAAARSGGLGLVSMEERARLLGGRLEIESARGSGTRVEVTLPLAP